jgi:hypothetical protein
MVKRAVRVVLAVAVQEVLVLVVLVALAIRLLPPHLKEITAAQWLELLEIPMQQEAAVLVPLEALWVAALAVMVLLRQYQVHLSLMRAGAVVVEIVLREQEELAVAGRALQMLLRQHQEPLIQEEVAVVAAMTKILALVALASSSLNTSHLHNPHLSIEVLANG